MDPTSTSTSSGITRPTHASIHARYEAAPDARGATHNHWTHTLQTGASATPIVHGAMDNDMKARASGQSFSLKTQPYWMRNKPIVSITSSVWVQPSWPIGCPDRYAEKTHMHRPAHLSSLQRPIGSTSPCVQSHRAQALAPGRQSPNRLKPSPAAAALRPAALASPTRGRTGTTTASSLGGSLGDRPPTSPLFAHAKVAKSHGQLFWSPSQQTLSPSGSSDALLAPLSPTRMARVTSASRTPFSPAKSPPAKLRSSSSMPWPMLGGLKSPG